MSCKHSRKGERGAALVELAIGATVLFLVMFGLIEFSRLLWVHNTLVDATRRGARYAVVSTQDADAVKNVVVYGTQAPAPGALPVVSNLNTGNVEVVYTNFGVKQGRVSVRITGYQFNFVPLVSATITLPDYHTTLTGESAGFVPPPPTPTP